MKPATLGVEAGISHRQPIPRELMHCGAVAEVFVTSLTARGADEFAVGAQLPRMHDYCGLMWARSPTVTIRWW